MWAGNEFLGDLVFVVFQRLEPAFKSMTKVAGQIKNNHRVSLLFQELVPGTGIEPVQP